MTQSLWNDEPLRPLQHLRVLDMTTLVPGAFVTRLLAQYGADVIKIEPLPDGDALRTVPDSALFELLNRGKRSIAMNLRSKEAGQVIRSMARESDLLVENFKEGVLDALGLGYSDLAMENQELLYVSMRSFSGGASRRSGHDLNIIAHSGIGEWFLENGAPNYSTLFGDMVGGAMSAALRLLLHLANPDRRGMHLVTSMDENFRTIFLPRAFEAFRAENRPTRSPTGMHRWSDGSKAHTRYYQCKDGQWVSLNAIQPRHWSMFCGVLGKTDWVERQNDAALVDELSRMFKDESALHWEAKFSEHDVCLFRVIPWKEHLNTSLATQQLGSDPFAWAGFAPQAGLLDPPQLGQDTYTTLTALGVSNREIADWIDRGVAWQAPNTTPREEPPSGFSVD